MVGVAVRRIAIGVAAVASLLVIPAVWRSGDRSRPPAAQHDADVVPVAPSPSIADVAAPKPAAVAATRNPVPPIRVGTTTASPRRRKAAAHRRSLVSAAWPAVMGTGIAIAVVVGAIVITQEPKSETPNIDGTVVRAVPETPFLGPPTDVVAAVRPRQAVTFETFTATATDPLAIAASALPPDWLATPSLPPQRVVAALAGDLLPLRDLLTPAFDDLAWSAGLAVIDLSTGEEILINGRQQFLAASTIKFFVVLSAAQDINEGRYTYDDIRRDIDGIMIDQSNESALQLTLRTGLDTVNQRLQTWDLTDTVIDHPAGYTAAVSPQYSDGQNLTTARDAARGLQLLYDARIADAEIDRTLVENLSRGGNRYGIQGSVPRGQGAVFYKVGWLPPWEGVTANHDIGIVEFERDGQMHAYALAMYNEGALPQWPADLFLLTTAQTVWDFFTTVRYPVGPSAGTSVAAAQ